MDFADREDGGPQCHAALLAPFALRRAALHSMPWRSFDRPRLVKGGTYG
jgi:hypothetical protein